MPVRPNRGNTVDFFFPITTLRQRERMGTAAYTLEARGNAVVSIDQPGKCVALYRHAHYKSDQPPWRNVPRYVPAGNIPW
jgi:hypothetical protein